MFQNVVVRLGKFHTACTLFAISGKQFGDEGLRGKSEKDVRMRVTDFVS